MDVGFGGEKKEESRCAGMTWALEDKQKLMKQWGQFIKGRIYNTMESGFYFVIMENLDNKNSG